MVNEQYKLIGKLRPENLYPLWICQNNESGHIN